jgi:P-type Ca2+ transporter type 2C
MSSPVLADHGVPVEPYRSDAADVVRTLQSDARVGLSADEIISRRSVFGPNQLAEVPSTPAWRRLAEQFTDRLILILIVAAVVAFFASGDIKTPAVVLTVVVVNAVVGFLQEQRAERSLDALRRMLTTTARVRRGGQTLLVPGADLVPGDIVIVEAGDRIAADGRLLVAENLEADEAVLTGESQPTQKRVDAVDRAGVSAGDRVCVVHMNTTVTRGRGELVVTATGMQTEIGRIAGLLNATESAETPLTKQLDGLANGLAKLAGVVVVAVFTIGLIRGQSISDMMLTAVALAVAAIPEGLPAVTAVTLARGVSQMAKQNAIVKRLASVETLGCTTVICSDKTGTLTLNEMTAVELVTQMRSHPVVGTGYSPEGRIELGDGDEPVSMQTALIDMALCNDAVIRRDDDGWGLVGDPTEGALIVLAAKGGLDVDDLRSCHPRVGELPFDSATKFMMTAHEMVDANGETRVRVIVKGAPDVLLDRSTGAIGPSGTVVPIDTANGQLRAFVDEMGGRGLRVLAIAQRELSTADFAEHLDDGGQRQDLVDGLTIVALIGIMDPPRAEAARAIAEAHRAGIAVKMITGDHGATAAAIGTQLGLVGEVMTGAEIDLIDDDELTRRLDRTAVFARVAPEHKLRLVDALQRQGNVVAMTGDGVNDAPALKKADLGIAMGITGTEVSKEAATMILTDDNFATIVVAVNRGRVIYDNIVKFVRFQLSTTLGFATLFLLAALFGVSDGKPFTAIAILWVNIVMDGPPAMALGLDRAGRDVMQRRPRPPTEKILTRTRWVAVGISAAVMAAGTLGVLMAARGPSPDAGVATVAGTMAFNTFVLFQFFNILNSRSDTESVFSRFTFSNRWLWVSLAAVLLLQVAVTHFGPGQRLFDTTSIRLTDWLVCTAVASSVLWLDEIRKLIIRTRNKENRS